MPDRSLSESPTQRAILSVTEHAQELKLSRARFYELVAEGFFYPPVFTLANHRPLYTAEMAERNLLAKTTGIGVNGSMKVFYRRRQTNAPDGQRIPRRNERSSTRIVQWTTTLRSLGLQHITEDQVTGVIAQLFPSGIVGLDEGEVIRAVFRHIRRLESA